MRPAHLTDYNASAFTVPSVADAYDSRPPYPDATFDILVGIIGDEPRRVLDAGCGTGFIARNLVGWVEHVQHVDAVDISPAMIERGKRLPRGDDPALSWIVGPMETTPLAGPYALITAGDSLHWMDWDVTLPRFSSLLSPQGFLAILGVGELPEPWDAELMQIIRRYSTIFDFQAFDQVQVLESRGLFQTVGSQTTEPIVFTQPLDAFIESFHGRASFVRERMGAEAAAAFDGDVRALMERYGGDPVTLQLQTTVTWGKPLPGNTQTANS